MSEHAAFRAALKSQYHAALATLRRAIEACPEDLWTDDRPANPFWRIAYHVLYYTDLYLQPGEGSFRPWEHHQTGIHHMDGISGAPEADHLLELPHRPPQTGVPYSKGEVLAYWSVVDGMVDDRVEALDLEQASSGFRWAREVPKLEHQLVNLRHVQHHAAQLGDRLRAATDVGLAWVRSGRDAPAAKPPEPL